MYTTSCYCNQMVPHQETIKFINESPNQVTPKWDYLVRVNPFQGISYSPLKNITGLHFIVYEGETIHTTVPKTSSINALFAESILYNGSAQPHITPALNWLSAKRFYNNTPRTVWVIWSTQIVVPGNTEYIYTVPPEHSEDISLFLYEQKLLLRKGETAIYDLYNGLQELL